MCLDLGSFLGSGEFLKCVRSCLGGGVLTRSVLVVLLRKSSVAVMFFCRYVVDAHEIETEGDETTEKATSVTEQDVSIMKNRQECPLQQGKYEILELAFCETPRRTEGTETHANFPLLQT